MTSSIEQTDEKDILSTLFYEHNLREVEAIFSKPNSVFVHYDILNRVTSRDMLYILLKHTLDLQKCSYDILMRFREWIVDFIINDQLKVKINLNCSDSTYGMPLWRLLMCKRTLPFLKELALAKHNQTQEFDILAQDRDGKIYSDRYHSRTGNRQSEKYNIVAIGHGTSHIYYNDDDALYDAKIEKYMKYQMMQEEMKQLKKRIASLEKIMSNKIDFLP